MQTLLGLVMSGAAGVLVPGAVIALVTARMWTGYFNPLAG
jgi:hypothetical protein